MGSEKSIHRCKLDFQGPRRETEPEEYDAVKMRSLYPFAFACLMFALSFQLFREYLLWFGFRDAHTSELDDAEHTLAMWFIGFSMVTGLWSLGLGWRSFRTDVSKPLLYACVFFLLAASVSVAIDLHFRTYMTGSTGG